MSLGDSFRELSEIRDAEKNLEKSINAYEEAHKVFTKEDYDLEYGRFQRGVARSFEQLSDVKDKRSNLEKSIDAYQEALQIFTIEEYPNTYAKTNWDLARVHEKLALQIDWSNNIKKSLDNLFSALKIWTPEVNPEMYSTANNDIAMNYLKLSKEDNSNYITHAESYFQAALKTNSSPFERARSKYGLGLVYWNTFRNSGNTGYLERSIQLFQESLKILSPDENPVYYSAAQNGLGNSYFDLANFEDKEENLQRAVTAYKLALEIDTFLDSPNDYALEQRNIGNAYKNLAEVRDTFENLEKAIDSFQNSLKVYTKESYPDEFKLTQNLLGNAYKSLAEIKDGEINLEKAESAYLKAIGISETRPTKNDLQTSGIKIANSVSGYGGYILQPESLFLRGDEVIYYLEVHNVERYNYVNVSFVGEIFDTKGDRVHYWLQSIDESSSDPDWAVWHYWNVYHTSAKGKYLVRIRAYDEINGNSKTDETLFYVEEKA